MKKVFIPELKYRAKNGRICDTESECAELDRTIDLYRKIEQYMFETGSLSKGRMTFVYFPTCALERVSMLVALSKYKLISFINEDFWTFPVVSISFITNFDGIHMHTKMRVEKTEDVIEELKKNPENKDFVDLLEMRISIFKNNQIK